MNEINFILNNLDTIGTLIPIFFALTRRTLITGLNKYIFFYLSLQFILNASCNVLAAGLKNNIFLYQVNCLGSLILMTIFFNLVIQSFKIHKWLKLISWGLVALLAVYMLIEPRDSFNSHSYSYTGLIIVIYALLYFYNKITHPSAVRITKEPVFWFVTGFFIYYSAAFMIFISYSILTQQQKIDTDLLWRLHNLIFFIMCVYITVGYLCNTSQKTY